MIVMTAIVRTITPETYLRIYPQAILLAKLDSTGVIWILPVSTLHLRENFNGYKMD